MSELRRGGAWWRGGLPLGGGCALVLLAGAVTVLSAGSTAQKPTTVTEQCVNESCHGGLVDRKVMHGPVAQKKCQACHQYAEPREHRFKPLPEPDQGCTQCHEMKYKTVVHEPIKGRCTVCHDPHGSPYKWMLVGEPTKGLCLGCHKQDDYSKKAFVHGPVTSGACTVCHEAHSAAQPKLLKDSPRNLCISCHKEMVPKPGEDRSIHAPVRDNCTACHDPHASNLKYELKQAMPNLCLSCHKNLKESLAASTVVHGTLMTQEGGCSSCHASHFSKLPKLQKQPQPEECLSCHDRTLKTADGRTLTNMAALLKDNPEHHGPIRLGSCTACHQPHGGTHADLLIADYPADFYAPFQVDRYKLCFNCHAPDLVLQSKGTGLTGFRDGDKNLHWLHVNQQKGRTCRACHEVHASRQPFHMRESVPFGTGGWMLAINFVQTPKGGSCTPGCHIERSYDHGVSPKIVQAVALLPKALSLVKPEPAKPPAGPAVGGGQDRGSYPVPAPPFSAGVFPCTGCHDPNLPVNTERRVLQKAHVNIQLHHDEEHRWCLDCHNADNRDVLRSASGAPIPFAEVYRLCGQCHGNEFKDWKAGVHGKRSGEWDGRKEYLLCVHCHDPHSPAFKPISPMPPPVRAGLVE